MRGRAGDQGERGGHHAERAGRRERARAADALYMDAAWDTPFDPSLTAPGPFTTAAVAQ